MRPLLRLGVLVAAGLTAAAASPAAVAPASTAPCSTTVDLGVLPVWARAGFSDPKPKMPHVIGRSGDIAAIIFGYPLLFPESKTRANKILWVSRVHQRPLDDLYIRAQRMSGTHPIGREVSRVILNGPGPSYVNLPSAGCWRLHLRWSGHTDTLDLPVRPLPR
jgi:hypothetical protein